VIKASGMPPSASSAMLPHAFHLHSKREKPLKGCKTSMHEPLFAQLVTKVLVSGLLSSGSIVDCGAHVGGESCLYATTAPNRTVHAIEPLPPNVALIRKDYGHLSNLQPMLGALGSSDRVALLTGPRTASMLVDVNKRPTLEDIRGKTNHRDSFRVYRLDSLFGAGGPWAAERFAFGHFDVEGSELDLLRGAVSVISRDRPIYTLEAGLEDTSFVRSLLKEVETLGYRVLMVPEQCGLKVDCRNLICVPREQFHAFWKLPLIANFTVSMPKSHLYDSLALMRVPLWR